MAMLSARGGGLGKLFPLRMLRGTDDPCAAKDHPETSRCAPIWRISGCEAPASLDCRGRTDAQVSRAQQGFNPLSGAAFTTATGGGL